MSTVRTVYEDVYVYSCNMGDVAIIDGEFPASGSYIDVSDFERFAFVISAGFGLDSVLTCQVQQAATISGTAKDITGAVWVMGATDDGKWAVIDVETRKLDLNNGYNYVTMDITGASGNDYCHVLFLGFNGGSKPVTQSVTYFDTSAIVVG